ncbi:MAG: alpha/beta hydrolase [Crocinitomicaceae bacterium]|nr:alpha/beta hydrolase [Crocinitomicaceae bacterium]|tara:strand:+ start:12383 stop:13351 length:969 start_codon:yes stop_codon:yes gene_type:complete
MPLLKDTYAPPLLLRNPHLMTIVPNKLRTIKGISYERERLQAPDSDFIDLDFSIVKSTTLVLILHGLEGNSDRAYAKAVVREANEKNWDACVFNQRGCSGEPNRVFSSYHSGKTDDFEFVLKWILKNYNYSEVHLVGFSLGGNITLKYLGENGSNVPQKIKSAVAISVPIHLESSAIQLAKRSNWVYMRRFLKSLKAKTQEKINRFPASNITVEELMKCKNFIDYDNLYTAPAHGFKDAKDYWNQCSSKQFLHQLKVPTLLINALDDPFLGEECYPYEEAQLNPQLNLITPKYGGHVGFVSSFPLSNTQWVEKQALQFIDQQ